jgi:hypothetical protein
MTASNSGRTVLICLPQGKPSHTRSAELLWRRYRRAKACIYGHREVATRLGDTSAFEAVTGADGVARFYLVGSPPRSELPIEIPAYRPLVLSLLNLAISSGGWSRGVKSAAGGGRGGLGLPPHPGQSWCCAGGGQ